MKKLLAVFTAIFIVAPAFAHWPTTEPVEHWPGPNEAPVQDETASGSPATTAKKQTLKESITKAVVKADTNPTLSLWYSNVKTELTEKGCKFIDDQDMLQRLGSVERYYQNLKKNSKQVAVWATGAEIATPFKCKDGATFSTPEFLAENDLDGDLTGKFNADMAAWRVDILKDKVNYTHYQAMEGLKKEVKAHADYAKAEKAFNNWAKQWDDARADIANIEIHGTCQHCISDVSRALDTVRVKYYELKAVSPEIARIVNNFLYADEFVTQDTFTKKSAKVETIYLYIQHHIGDMQWPVEEKGFSDRMVDWKDEIGYSR